MISKSEEVILFLRNAAQARTQFLVAPSVTWAPSRLQDSQPVRLATDWAALWQGVEQMCTLQILESHLTPSLRPLYSYVDLEDSGIKDFGVIELRTKSS